MGTKQFSNPQALRVTKSGLWVFGLLNRLVPLVVASNYYLYMYVHKKQHGYSSSISDVDDEPIYDWDDITATVKSESEVPHIIKNFTIFLVTWQFIFGISNAAINVLINFFHKFLHLLIDYVGCEKLQ